MRTLHYLPAVLLLLAAAAWAPAPAQAAESYDNCTGFINSLPTTITTQGVWCLNQNLSTAITSGNAITIAANNVTIDCNDFKIGGLAAGNSSSTTGIFSNGRQNATVRNCAIRGFYYGINLNNGAGHLVENNRLDNNLYMGIRVIGDNNRVRHNAVYDTGGSPNSGYSSGIYAEADIIGNTVSGVFSAQTNASPRGIHAIGSGHQVRGNRVRGLVAAGSGDAIGINANGSGITLDDNQVSATPSTTGTGIFGYGDDTFCTGNTAINFTMAYYSCDYATGNLPATP